MAEQAASAVASAVIGGVTDRALTTVMRKLRSRSRQAATHEKLQRLETLVLKLRCAVEVSEKHAIGSASLLEWRDRLREAAAEGGAVVLDFQRRAREDGEAASSTRAPGQQPPGAGAGAGALYFTRSALSGMAQRVRDATRRLFSTDEDMKRLDSMLEKMEKLSPDITLFATMLQLEVSRSPELRQGPAKRRGLASTSIPAKRRQKRKATRENDESSCSMLEEKAPSPRLYLPLSFSSARVTLWESEQRPSKAVAASEITQLASAAEAPEDSEWEARILARELEPTLRRMDGYVKATDDRDMGGLEWLAEWVTLLREAVERGYAVLQTLRSGSDVIHRSGGGLQEDGELYSVARAMELLEEPLFAVLVDLCPRKH